MKKLIFVTLTLGLLVSCTTTDYYSDDYMQRYQRMKDEIDEVMSKGELRLSIDGGYEAIWTRVIAYDFFHNKDGTLKYKNRYGFDGHYYVTNYAKKNELLAYEYYKADYDKFIADRKVVAYNEKILADFYAKKEQVRKEAEEEQRNRIAKNLKIIDGDKNWRQFQDTYQLKKLYSQLIRQSNEVVSLRLLVITEGMERDAKGMAFNEEQQAWMSNVLTMLTEVGFTANLASPSGYEASQLASSRLTEMGVR